jgi:hypothetical protein
MATSSLTTNAPDVEADIAASHLYNEDLAPVPPSRRKWGVLSFAALWISMAACIPTYMLASSLIGGGMNWWQAVLTVAFSATDRAHPDGAQRACRHQVRHSVPSADARLVRHACGANVPGDGPRTRRLRLVRHPSVDRRRGHLSRSSPSIIDLARRQSAPLTAAGHHRHPVRQLPHLLGDQHVLHLQRHRTRSAWLNRQAAPLLHRARLAAALVGPRRGRWTSVSDPVASLSLRSRHSPRPASSGASSGRADRRWSASGRRSRSTSPTSLATPKTSATRSSARPSGCP